VARPEIVISGASECVEELGSYFGRSGTEAPISWEQLFWDPDYGRLSSHGIYLRVTALQVWLMALTAL